MVISAASDNDGNYIFESVRSFVVASVHYVAITATGASFDDSVGSGTVQFQTVAASTFSFSKGTAGVLNNLRTFEVMPTDIGLVQYRSETAGIFVANPATETNLSLQRLFEFQRMIAVGGNPVTWNTSGDPNVLKFDSNFILRFFNREATYTVLANPSGITIGTDQVAYVSVPDEDEDSTLTLEVTDLGDGVLDRHGRDIFVMFWNNTGTLCTFFLFQQVPAGETAMIGYFGATGGGTSDIYTQEDVLGINGIQTNFSLQGSPASAAKLKLYKNGGRLSQGVGKDYKVITQVTFTTAPPLATEVYAEYPIDDTTWTQEDLVGINGIQTVFTLKNLASSPLALGIFANGRILRQGVGKDYTVSTVIVTSVAPAIGEFLYAIYAEVSESFTQEDVLGANGVQTVFTFENVPSSSGSVGFYQNGRILRQGVGKDYTILGGTVTTAVPPPIGQPLYVTYQL
jgi:hypothetical protein